MRVIEIDLTFFLNFFYKEQENVLDFETTARFES